MAFLIKELADYMAARGHSVDVLTGFPNWPSGNCFPGYRADAFTRTAEGKVTVHRMPFLASPNGPIWKRLLDFKSFERAIGKYGRTLDRPDMIYVHVPPNEDAIAALRLARQFACKVVVNVQDIQPDSTIDLGYIKNGMIIKLLRMQEQKMYRHASHITVIGESFRQRLLSKGIARERISIIPNWIDARAVAPVDRETPLRAEWGIAPSRFVVLYAGTFGRVHGTNVLLETAKALSNRDDILFLFVGQGYDFQRNRDLAAEWRLKNVQFRNFVPRSRLSELQSTSDVSLVTLRKGFGHTSVPSKVLGYMAAGRGVIGLVDDHCDTARLINAAGCGCVLEPENPAPLAEELARISHDRRVAAQWGGNARKYILDHLDAPVVLDQAAKLLESL